MLKKAILMGALVLATAAPAQAPRPGFAERIAASRLDIALVEGRLRGAGAELLGREIAASQFFFVGEQHGAASIAEIEAALHRMAASAGYDHVALEIGPSTAPEVERLIRSGRGRLADYVRRPGNSMIVPFMFWAEETALAEQVVALSPARSGAIWGLDQEFLGGLPLLLPTLEARTGTPAQHTALAALRDRLAKDPMVLGMMPEADLKPLKDAFPDDPLVADMIISNRIYAPFTSRGGSVLEANTIRENYMKAQFQRQFEAAERASGKPPRVFLKFGANHAMRGFSTTDVPALGNFIAEWGLSKGLRTANLVIDCIGGEMNDPQTGKNDPCEAQLPASSQLYAQLSPAPLTLIDLRPLRERMPRDLDPETRRMILAFDFYLAVRNARPATPLVKR